MTRRTSRMLTRVVIVTSILGVGIFALKHRKPAESAEATPNAKPKTVTLMSSGEDDHAAKPASNKTPPKPADKPGPTGSAPKPDPKPDAAKPDPKPTPKPDGTGDTRAKPAAAVVAANPSSILPEGKAKLDAGDLLAGRKILNDGLVTGQLAGADAVAAKQLITEANRAIIFSPRLFPQDPWATTHLVASGEVLKNVANKEGITSDLALVLNGMTDARKLRAGSTIKLIRGPFHLVITKKSFNLDVYLGSPGEKDSLFVANYPVGLGKDDSTPTGNWMISDRIPNPKWWGARGQHPIESGDPKNPLGKYWLALAGTSGKAEGQQSYGIHGTIEPETIGKEASMGCIRMRNEDVAVIYALVLSHQSTVVVRD